jgi:hypothetical protein
VICALRSIDCFARKLGVQTEIGAFTLAEDLKEKGVTKIEKNAGTIFEALVNREFVVRKASGNSNWSRKNAKDCVIDRNLISGDKIPASELAARDA